MKKREDQLQRLEQFLNSISKVKKSGLILSSTILKRDVSKAVTDFFKDKDLITLEETIDIKEKIDDSFNTSLKQGKPVFVSYSAQTVPVVLRRLEQVLNDGYLEESTPEGRKAIKPANGWFAIVWVDQTSLKDKEFPIKEFFDYKLIL